jgi:16S rRNA (cytosine1402-N4)-methyltransferase
MASGDPIHVSVMAQEVLFWLNPEPGQTLVDATLGAGGHSRLLAERVIPSGKIISLDRDPRAVESGRRRLRTLPIECVQADFRDLAAVLHDLGRAHVDGVLLDLGLSSDQLADEDRGFSFDAAGELDLRFDVQRGEPAWRLLERLRAEQIADILYHYGEERFSRRIARRIVETRHRAPIRTAAQFAELVRRCVPRAKHHPIDPATRSFQALRIAVNDEMGALDAVLQQIPDCLRPGGKVAVISFHSLEDRRVKHAFRDDPRYVILTKKPIRPIESEVQDNPRSRSAKLRVAERAPISN